ncbi:WhiB family transcriptional regulator [Embleya sp. NPDC059237]|uniref:WhiB family transcriptional regulator n=1 Tax=Embleya sp. NPDC059237 TaxID=3346784 RepID=UPI0036BDA0B3
MTDWRHHARCRNTDVHPELFFPDGETSPHHLAQIARAKAICARCPVQLACGNWALARPGCEAGIWGGLTENERRRMKRRGSKRRAAA